jgi:rhodanese-related sulfurtransferase
MCPRATVVVLVVSLAATILVGCKADTSGLTTWSVDQVAKLIDQDRPITLCDANSEDTRSKFGVLPNAILLSNYRDYDTASELPADTNRRLIFYCYNPMCSSAAEAARKAIGAGHTQVSVMSDGIKGWVGAGKPVTKAAPGR